MAQLFNGLLKKTCHKPEVPLRPIVSAVGSYTHNLAKYLNENNLKLLVTLQ